MSSESKQQEDGTSTASIMSRRLNDVTEAGYEAETETDKQQEEEVEVVVEEGITSSSSSVLHESDNENGSNIKRSDGGDGIGSIATDNTNGVTNSKDAETDDLETGIRNGGGVASVEESSSSTSSVVAVVAAAAAFAADEIDDNNKEQTNKIKDKDIKEDINRNRDHYDIMDNKKPYARTDNNTNNNKKNNSEDNNDIEAGNNMLMASGQKTRKGSTSSSIDDHPTPDDDNFPSSSLPPSSLISSSSDINSINQTRSAATSSKIIRRSQSEVGAFAIDSPFSSSSNNNNNNHDQDTTTIISAMMTDGVYNASVSLAGSSTTIPTNTDTNLNSQLSSGGSSYGSSHFIVEAVRVDDDCVVVASIVENNNNTSSNNSINSNENDEGKSATKAAAATVAVKKKHRYVIGFVAVMILIVIIIIISVLLFGNNNSNNKINTATTNNSNDKINTATTNNSNDKINTATTTIASSTKVPIPTGWPTGLDTYDYSTGSDKYDRRFEKLLEIITPFSGLDDFDVFSNEKFERNRIDAFTWLLTLDLITTDIDLALPENELKVIQRYILALLYFSTNGQSWDEQHNFLSPNLDECDWTFVEGESDCVIDCEFHSKNGVVVKGVTCDKQGRVERLRLWWTSMSGTLPAEISYLSDSLVELNLAGGSITGAIPTSFEKLTNLELLWLNDHCLSGTIPSKLSQLPKLNTLALGGNYELYGSLHEFCNGTQYKEQYIHLTANCDSNFCDTSSSIGDGMDYYEPNVECECCVCCNPDTFECCSPLGDTWTSYYHGDVSSSTDIPKSFDRPCLSEKSYDWLEDECPCLEDINDDTGIFQGYCTKNCTKVGTIPSYKPQVQQ